MNHIMPPVHLDRLIPGLTKEEKLIPRSIIQDHCDEYTITEDLENLRSLFEIGIVTEEYNNPQKRMALLVWFKNMARVLESFHILLGSEQTGQLET